MFILIFYAKFFEANQIFNGMETCEFKTLDILYIYYFIVTNINCLDSIRVSYCSFGVFDVLCAELSN